MTKPGNEAGEVLREKRRLGEGWTLVLRRGYMAASNPLQKEHGTLIVRNSSLVFGRDKLKHPAYWTERSYDREGLAKLTQREIEDDFSHSLSPALYQRDGGRRFVQAGLKATEALLALPEHYYAQRYDTRYESAWQQVGAGEAKLIGGHASPSFASFVSRLERMYLLSSEGRLGYPMPELCFVNPDYAPWGELPYTNADGQQTTRLAINEEQLEGLGRLAKGEQRVEDLDHTGLREFLQQAGLNQAGQLMLVDPR